MATVKGEHRQGGVLVVVAGGNIGLIAARDPYRNVTRVRPATLPEIQEYVLGPAADEKLVVRELDIEGERVRVKFQDERPLELRQPGADPELLDSAQVDPTLWSAVAKAVHDSYDVYDGFVVLHGLDTMAYTASALSFMLENLRKPVIFTGSQKPLNFARTDAIQNIVSSITLAATQSLRLRHPIPEVAVFCHDTLFRGNRASMVSASSYRSFDSPNYPVLATVGDQMEIQSHAVRQVPKAQRLNLRGGAGSERGVIGVDPGVVILDVFPGIDASVFQSMGTTTGGKIRGVLLRTYGMGTAPTSRAVLEALARLVDDNVVVLNVSQARSGRISYGLDPVSLRLLEQGVISGVDMTTEAAYAKLVVLLSEGKNPIEVSDRLQHALCGEQSQDIFLFHFLDKPNETQKGHGLPDSDLACGAPLRAPQVVDRHRLDERADSIRLLQLRLLGVQPTKQTGGSRTIDFSASLVDPHRDGTGVVATLTRDILRWNDDSRTLNVAYDISAYRDQLLSPETILRLDTNEPIQWRRLSIAAFVEVLK